MQYKTHANFGLLFGLLYINYKVQHDTILFLILCAIAALLPDIDHQKSYINKKITHSSNKIIILIIYTLIIGGLIYFYKLYILIVTYIWVWLALTKKHRGITHSLIGMFIFIIPFLFTEYYLSILIGYSSHLFSDALTINGISLLYPLEKRYSIGNFKVGKKGEKILYSLLVLLNVYLILQKGGLIWMILK